MVKNLPHSCLRVNEADFLCAKAPGLQNPVFKIQFFNILMPVLSVCLDSGEGEGEGEGRQAYTEGEGEGDRHKGRGGGRARPLRLRRPPCWLASLAQLGRERPWVRHC